MKGISCFCLLLMMLLFLACYKNTGSIEKTMEDRFDNLQETQLTTDPKGHFLHQFQYFSPNNEWIAYDTRNDDTKIGSTCCIEMVNVKTKEIIILYRTKNQSEFGPGVGAATFNPTKEKVLFIHGLMNSNSEKPYGFSRRTGVGIDIKFPQKPIFIDARNVVFPYTPGALRGGTHAHSWSQDGEWVSFTYNDDIITNLAEKPNSKLKDLRMVGISAPLKAVNVAKEASGENIDGEMFSVIISEVTDNPIPESNQIDRAHGDVFIGYNGYFQKDGAKQSRAVAFLGDTKDADGNTLTEVYVCDLPKDITAGFIQGTEKTRPIPPLGTKQRRITYTENRKFSGVRGPRHSIRSNYDGSLLFFMMKDDRGIVQIYNVSPNGGEIKQVTHNHNSVETTFDLSPDAKFLAYGINEKVHITDVKNGNTIPIEPTQKNITSDLKSIAWSNDGNAIAYNRKVTQADTSFYQVFILKTKQ